MRVVHVAVSIILSAIILCCRHQDESGQRRSTTVDDVTQNVGMGLEAVDFSVLPPVRVAGDGIYTDSRQYDSGQIVNVDKLLLYGKIAKWGTTCSGKLPLKSYIRDTIGPAIAYERAVGFSMLYSRSIYERDEMHLGCLLAGRAGCRILIASEDGATVIDSRLSDSVCSIIRGNLANGLESYSRGPDDDESGRAYFVLKSVSSNSVECVLVSYFDVLDLDPEAEWLRGFGGAQRRANHLAGVILRAIRDAYKTRSYPH